MTQRACNDNFHSSPFLNAMILHGKGETGVAESIEVVVKVKVYSARQDVSAANRRCHRRVGRDSPESEYRLSSSHAPSGRGGTACSLY